MDAKFKEKRRKRLSSQREKRWSMNSQRLEEIVAELMRPIGDLRHCFDTDLSALLEEYLTEAGLHALDAEEGAPAAAAVAPNYAELAILLQQSVSIYGRKVDFLYQHVLSVSEALQTNTMEMSNNSAGEAGAGGTPRRRGGRGRGAAGGAALGEFEDIVLEHADVARRDAAPARPPPTLPRMYIELEPRVLSDCDVPLRDYQGEPIGLLRDFLVAGRLQDGMLVDELEASGSRGSALRAIPLLELRAALQARAPPAPPPLSLAPPAALHALQPHDPHDEPPCAASTPLPPDEPADPPDPADPPAAPAAMPPPPPKRDRKRRSDVDVDELFDDITRVPLNGEKWSKQLNCEFVLEERWVSKVVAARLAHILRVRARCPDPRAPPPPFRGFDFTSVDLSGFLGWSTSEALEATKRSQRLSSTFESEDDGFFSGDSDISRVEESLLVQSTEAERLEAERLEAERLEAERLEAERLEAQRLERERLEAERRSWESWQRGAAAQEARGVDVRAAAAAVLAALPAPPAPPAPRPPPAPFGDVLRAAAERPEHVSHLFLATLFLANAGHVEVIQGEPLSLGTFSLRARRADAAAAADFTRESVLPPPDLH